MLMLEIRPSNGSGATTGGSVSGGKRNEVGEREKGGLPGGKGVAGGRVEKVVRWWRRWSVSARERWLAHCRWGPGLRERVRRGQCGFVQGVPKEERGGGGGRGTGGGVADIVVVLVLVDGVVAVVVGELVLVWW